MYSHNLVKLTFYFNFPLYLKPSFFFINMAKKYYAVAKGSNTGVFTSWDACKSQVHGVSGATFKSFSTPEAASSWMSSNGAGSSSSSSSYSGSSSSSSSGSGYHYSGYVSHSTGGGISKPSIESRSYKTKSSPSTTKSHKIYTDGASSNNQSRHLASAGVGVYFGDNDKRNISKPVYGEQTNQRAELQAIESALKVVSNELALSKDSKHYSIATDSKYSIDSLTKWGSNWKENGWKTSKGTDVANRDVIEKCMDSIDDINKEYTSRGMEKIQFEHVKGHSGIEGNEKADQLAVKGSKMNKK